MRESFEFAAGGGLLKADAAGSDVGLEVVFTFDGGVGEAAEHGDLADVIEGVSDRALEESLGGAAERFAGGQVFIKFLIAALKRSTSAFHGSGAGPCQVFRP